jgi:gamma-glutamylcyclotransferase (GGCT)/AIG2-like uncharacterized protein YtfP/predicted kinase
VTQRLFVYGTLAPGRPNAHVLADVAGHWQPATVVGRLLQQGWGAAVGYPGIVLDEHGDEVQGFLFSSDSLDQHWNRLDEFEGDGYERVLTAVKLHDGTTVEAYIYSLRVSSSGHRNDRRQSRNHPMSEVRLLFLCGKMAAGKSTLARRLAQENHALLLVEDDLLRKLFPGEIHDISDYVRFTTRIKDALSDHIVAALVGGVSVVLDFPGNTRKQRGWFRELFERAGVRHELHFIDASDDLCKRQLKERNQDLPVGTAFTTEAEFDAITQYFQAPSSDEGFYITIHAPDRTER